MFDLLAAISSVDPPALLAWLILAFAAGMYPIGIMLGSSCSPCCGKCGCTTGALPEYLSVSFSGLTYGAIQSGNLLSLSFESDFGSGAAGSVIAPHGTEDNAGPISSVALSSGGSGYAKLGRVAPTITASGGSGTGATFSVSTTSAKDANGIPSWSVTGVTVAGAPAGYVDGDQITFNVATGDTEEQAAAATLHTTRTAPTLTAAVSGGSGAAFSVTTAANGTTPQTWSVTGVTVTNGGTGYPATGSVTFNKASGDTEAEPASATFYSGRVAPTVTVAVGGSGSGAVLSGTLSSGTDYYGKTYWYISSVSVTNGGSGYSEYDPVDATVTDGVSGEYSYFYALVSVDGGGAVTGVTVYDGGEFFKSNGIIAGVEIDYYGGGSYYREGSPYSVSVEHGGKYYRNDATAPPYVSDVTVSVSQSAPSAGSGAAITATVDDDTSSPTFGRVTGLTLDSGGDAYLLWYFRRQVTCPERFNGKTFTIKRMDPPQDCSYRRVICEGTRGSSDVIAVSFSAGPPVVTLSVQDPVALFTFTIDDPQPDCSQLSFSGTDIFGGSVSVAEASADDSPSEKQSDCSGCCVGLPRQTIYEDDEGASDPNCSKATCEAAGGQWLDSPCQDCGCAGANCPDVSFQVSISGSTWCGAPGQGTPYDYPAIEFEMVPVSQGVWGGGTEEDAGIERQGVPLKYVAGGNVQCQGGFYVVYVDYHLESANDEGFTGYCIGGNPKFGIPGPFVVLRYIRANKRNGSGACCPSTGTDFSDSRFLPGLFPMGTDSEATITLVTQ